MNSRLLLVPYAALIAGALVSAGPRAAGHDLRPRFIEGQKLSIQNKVVMTLGLDDAAASFAGQELPEVPMVDVEVTATQVVEEELLGVADGAVTKLRRFHDTLGMRISGEAGVMGQNQTIDESQDLPLEGRTLELTRGEDGAVSVEDVTAGDDLEPLEEAAVKTAVLESHYETMLPKDPVEVGGSWDVGSAMIEEFSRQVGAQAEGDEQLARLFSAVQDILEGQSLEASGRLVSVEGNSANIEWKMTVEVTIDDLFDMVRDIVPPDALEGMPEDAEGSLELALEAKGHGVFDLATHQLESLDLDGEYSLSLEVAISQDGMDISGHADVSGSIEVEGGVTIAE